MLLQLQLLLLLLLLLVCQHWRCGRFWWRWQRCRRWRELAPSTTTRRIFLHWIHIPSPKRNLPQPSSEQQQETREVRWPAPTGILCSCKRQGARGVGA